MFLKTVRNPYLDDQPTRSVFYRPDQSQTWAINAEKLHKTPSLLNAVAPGRGAVIRALDALAWIIAIVGVAASVKLLWWAFIPALVASVGMHLTNRKTAGTIARKAMANSNEHFLYLHSQKLIWLVTGHSMPGRGKLA